MTKQRAVKTVMYGAVAAIVGMAVLSETVAPTFPLWPGVVVAIIWLIAFGVDTTL